MSAEQPTRSDLAEQYLATLPYDPYPVQEEAILEWFTNDEGILVCAPTGMGKTLVAHGALFEALHRGETAYYTTPLIALTEQKFHELQECAVRWGFAPEDVGLVTGNRRVNPDAKILVVVAEILLNRLLNPASFSFENVSAVVVDEFHSFNDPERGIVWELTLSMLPAHVRLMLLSATVGNASLFLGWLSRCHGRRVALIQDDERRVPLAYEWVPDKLLNEQIEQMAQGSDEQRRTPALVFCFNREECWTVAEQLKGLSLLDDARRTRLRAELDTYDLTKGVGPKIKQILYRGVGVHHAGMLPKYRRLVEDLYGQKLLSVAVCTETLAAGINLPARSVVLTTLMKGPFGKKKIINASIAHQIFGRAGRPQYDDHGYVYALAHEDDVRILRWQQKFDSIPEGTKDPGLMKAKKAMRKKRPTRRDNQQYWMEPQFHKLIAAPSANLESRGTFPWRLLAYLLQKSPEVDRVRTVIGKRLMAPPKIEEAEKNLDRMLRSLHAGGFVVLEPEPPSPKDSEPKQPQAEKPQGSRMLEQVGLGVVQQEQDKSDDRPPPYRPILARPTPELEKLLIFRSIHPIYGAFLLDHLGIADRNERIQLLESVLGLPRQLLRSARVPLPEEMPPGPLAERVDTELVARGLIVARPEPTGRQENRYDEDEDEDYQAPLAEKVHTLFEAHYPDVRDVQTQAIWAGGEVLRFNGDFNKYVSTHNLVKQEGLIFRHLLRLILMCGELAAICPAETTMEEWQADLRQLADEWADACRRVDPQSTEKMIQAAGAADVVEGEAHIGAEVLPPKVDEDKLQESRWEQISDDLSADEG